MLTDQEIDEQIRITITGEGGCPALTRYDTLAISIARWAYDRACDDAANKIKQATKWLCQECNGPWEADVLCLSLKQGKADDPD